MAAVVAPAQVSVVAMHRIGESMKPDIASAERRAESLQRDVKAAVIRMEAAAEASKQQVAEALTFEERTRITLRGLMVTLGEDDAGTGS